MRIFGWACDLPRKSVSPSPPPPPLPFSAKVSPHAASLFPAKAPTPRRRHSQRGFGEHPHNPHSPHVATPAQPCAHDIMTERRLPMALALVVASARGTLGCSNFLVSRVSVECPRECGPVTRNPWRSRLWCPHMVAMVTLLCQLHPRRAGTHQSSSTADRRGSPSVSVGQPALHSRISFPYFTFFCMLELQTYL